MKVINTVNSIRRLANKAETTLEKIKPLLKEEGNKKINEIQSKIPTEANIKQRMMDEIDSRGPELVCSIETRNRVDFIYNRLKSITANLQNRISQSKDKLLKLQERLTKIDFIINTIRGIIDTLKALIPTFNIVVQASKVGLRFLKNQFADGAATVKLGDLIKNSESAVQEIQNSVRTFENKLERTIH